jgi:DNA invertase Pin-like site-specific DNA recombinase
MSREERLFYHKLRYRHGWDGKPAFGYYRQEALMIIFAAAGRPPRKLTLSKIKMIRQDPRPHWKIADAFGISRSHVSKIKAGQRWNRTFGFISNVFFQFSLP